MNVYMENSSWYEGIELQGAEQYKMNILRQAKPAVCQMTKNRQAEQARQ
jgi:hypothetical protein